MERLRREQKERSEHKKGDPSYILRDTIVQRGLRPVVKNAGRFLTSRNAPGFGVKAPSRRSMIMAKWNSSEH